MIPLMLKLTIKDKKQEKGSRGFNLWFPLFLIWFIVLPILAVIAPIVLIVSAIMWPSSMGRLIMFSYFTIFEIIWFMSGLKVDIRSRDKTVFINLR